MAGQLEDWNYKGRSPFTHKDETSVGMVCEDPVLKAEPIIDDSGSQTVTFARS
jgi:hypothetical protein